MNKVSGGLLAAALRACALLIFGYFPALAILDRNLDWLPALPWSIPVVAAWIVLSIRIVGQPAGALYRLATGAAIEVGCFCCCVLAAVCAIIYLYLWQMNIQLVPVTFRKQGDAFEYVPHLLTYLAIAAVFEESVFRGIVQSVLKSRAGTPVAIIVSSALFTIWHFGNSQYVLMVPLYFVLGISFGIVFNSTCRLLPAVLVHFVYNCAASMLPSVARVPSHHESTSAVVITCIVIAIAAGWIARRLSLRPTLRSQNA